jgi:hypothetical protein
VPCRWYSERTASGSRWSTIGQNCRPATELNTDVAAVGVDNDNVYAFNRGAHPMIVFDRHGNFLRSVLGRRRLQARARRLYVARRHDFPDR